MSRFKQVGDDQYVNEDLVICVGPSNTAYASSEIDLLGGVRSLRTVYSKWTPQKVYESLCQE